MWKKLREASSGVTLNSVTNLFRGKSYAKFGSKDELCDEQGTSEMVDEENNIRHLVTDTKDSVSNATSTVDDNDISDDEDCGFGNADRPARPQLSFKENINSLDRLQNLNENHILSHKTQNGHVVPNPKTEVKELVNSYSQRRYQQLEDSDYYQEHEVSRRMSDNNNENVFHRAEDVHKETVRNPTKQKRSKKVQFFKLFRRIPCVPNQSSLR